MPTLRARLDRLGEVFTPPQWACWLIDRFQILDEWYSGASVADPTAGNGSFAIALCCEAVKRGYSLNHQNISRLFLAERQATLIEEFKQKFYNLFGLYFPEKNIVCTDVVLSPPCFTVDILIGNPPWINFADLPTDYKEILKPYFVAEGLVPDKRQVLLGASRMDLSALILKVCLSRLLNRNGKGFFFIPSSLFFGDDAHRGFRSYLAGTRSFRIEQIWDFVGVRVFDSVSTAYCAASFYLDRAPNFPIAYFRGDGLVWEQYHAVPLSHPSDPLRILQVSQPLGYPKLSLSKSKVDIPKEQQPRQGANTCGANAIYIFADKPAFLPDEFLYPLATKELFHRSPDRAYIEAQKWILIPYNRATGKPLTASEVQACADLWSYLLKHRLQLQSRKGALLGAQIARGYWWSLLGVGVYSFLPYKVMWESYGERIFNPTIISTCDGKPWQGNQAMHAFIPCRDRAQAEEILAQLQSTEFQTTLTELNGAGKRNWAQPGKIKKLLSLYCSRS
ncbi:Eco57I restriction-modification methylase domain-containing protein [Pseudanabaena sp. PCC 6802]|uniref:Eco57I restriction-modification methylase domain-containing protein n=1 Tax=Pseudanabaena sp. PCC 6802 TaxID=118173 RepID=UPI00034B4082|nr:hypothetical protein [Pseudanabaena sp. PCC 6802]